MENVIKQGTVNQEKTKVSTGKTTGLKFIQGFGFFLDKYKDETGNRDLVKMSMLEEYPAKAGSIEKWLDWYKGYFNMGKIKGYNQDKSLTLVWKR